MKKLLALTLSGMITGLYGFAPLPVTEIAAKAQELPIISGESRFHPVFARNGMVAAQEALAADVGVEILKKGGNAVDAAVATGFALAVTLPRAGNLGGGGFMMVHLAETGESVALDYRERAPSASDRDMFLDDEGNADRQKSRYSGLAVGVPGTVAGFHLAHEKYGSGNLSFADLIAPAITLAEDGFAVSVDLASSLASRSERLMNDPEAARIFYKGGEAPKAGDILKQPDLAETLKRIAAEGPSAFYEGPVAQAIAATVTDRGGRMTTADLAAYEAKIREPVSGTFRGHEIFSMPPPSSGGVHLVQILNILEGFDLKETGAGSAATIHMMAEAMKPAYADRSKYLGDPDFFEVPVSGLTSRDYAKTLAANIRPDAVQDASELAPGNPLPFESDETTHYSVADKDGNLVSNTYTLNFSYGAGFMAKGTGVFLNNELDDFSAKPGVPNAYGLIGGQANAVEPNKRPLSSMTPTLVLKDGKPFMATGSPGGSRIITTTLQVILNVIEHEMNIAEAVAFPRVHHQWQPDEIRVERGLAPDTVAALEALGHTVVQKWAMGSANSLMMTENGLIAGTADPRRIGAKAAGY